jgi:hypothetical protein
MRRFIALFLPYFVGKLRTQVLQVVLALHFHRSVSGCRSFGRARSCERMPDHVGRMSDQVSETQITCRPPQRCHFAAAASQNRAASHGLLPSLSLQPLRQTKSLKRLVRKAHYVPGHGRPVPLSHWLPLPLPLLPCLRLLCLLRLLWLL